MAAKHTINRRTALATFGAAMFTTRGLFAEQLAGTPWMTEGPFYPDNLPLDRDNDLIIIGDQTTPAVGVITHLSGRILDAKGEPIKDAVIEIWQCDSHAVYHHTIDAKRKKDRLDKNFQGYGRFTTGKKGEYRFRTIKPVPYPGRPAPHIHVKVSRADHELLTSQIFIDGFADNAKDGIFRRVTAQSDSDLVTAKFVPIAESKMGEVAAKHDLVIGRTPDDRFRPRRR